MPEVTFVKQKRTISVEHGENLREAAIRAKLSVYPHIFKILNCRGRGLCTSCTVEIDSDHLEPRNETENQQLKKKLKNNPKLRLACQVKVTGDMVVKTHV